jgi:hypothetical protein
VLRWVGWGIAASFRAGASLVAENICLRQQLLVLLRRQPRPRILDVDRRFWVLACRWFCPHRAIGQRAPWTVDPPIREARHRKIIGEPVLGGLHHVYHLAA